MTIATPAACQFKTKTNFKNNTFKFLTSQKIRRTLKYLCIDDKQNFYDKIYILFVDHHHHHQTKLSFFPVEKEREREGSVAHARLVNGI